MNESKPRTRSPPQSSPPPDPNSPCAAVTRDPVRLSGSSGTSRLVRRGQASGSAVNGFRHPRDEAEDGVQLGRSTGTKS